MQFDHDADSLISEFSAATQTQWRDKTQGDLDTETAEGVTVRALYGPDDAVLDTAIPPRTPGWAIAQRYAIGAPERLMQMIREDVTRGAAAAWICIDEAQQAGCTGGSGRSGAVLSREDIPGLLDAVGRGASLAIDAGLQAPELATALIEARGTVLPDDAVLCDPLAVLASTGTLGRSVDDAYAGLARTTSEVIAAGSTLRTVSIDTVPAHDAGASAEQEVALAIAGGLEHLQRLQAHGLSAAAAMPHIVMRMAVVGELMVEVAKLRAVRRLWARVRAHAGVGAGEPTPLWAQTSWRHATARDPWVNLLRGTVSAFAAAVGGASAIAVAPFTQALGEPAADARRWALNTQHILQGESHLGAVDDPAAGSFAFESLTDELARGAWAQVRAWLGRGGVATLLERGELQSEIAARAAKRSQALATGRLVSTGTTLYPHLDEPPLEAEVGAAPDVGALPQPSVRVPPLSRTRLTEPFEALRDRSEASPRVTAHLVTVGEPNKARAQVDFARNFVSVGGMQAAVGSLEQTLRETAVLAIVCGPPDTLEAEGSAAISALRTAGVTRVLVAGRPTDALREAGAHDFVHRGRDVVALLTGLAGDLRTATAQQGKA